MPIFEGQINQEDFKRQQEALNAKVKRKEMGESYENMVRESLGHDGGDCWEEETDE